MSRHMPGGGKQKMSWWCDEATRTKLEALREHIEAHDLPGANVTLAAVIRTAVHQMHNQVICVTATEQDKTE